MLIVFTGVITYRPKGNIACSITGGKGCSTASSFQKWMFGIAVAFYGIGAFVAYGLVPVLGFFEV